MAESTDPDSFFDGSLNTKPGEELEAQENKNRSSDPEEFFDSDLKGAEEHQDDFETIRDRESYDLWKGNSKHAVDVAPVGYGGSPGVSIDLKYAVMATKVAEDMADKSGSPVETAEEVFKTATVALCDEILERTDYDVDPSEVEDMDEYMDAAGPRHSIISYGTDLPSGIGRHPTEETVSKYSSIGD